MRIHRISLRNFRRFSERAFSFTDRTLVVGPNGTGKTTVVEACAVSLGGRSFRTNELRECIHDDRDYFFVRTTLDAGGIGDSVITYGFDRKGAKRIGWDGKAVSRRLLIARTSFVLCTHEDIEMMSGSPKRRRDFLDRVVMGSDRGYIEVFSQYIRYLKQKTVLLKGGKRSGLVPLNRAAVPLMATIREQRRMMADRLVERFVAVAEKAGVPLSLEIETPVESQEEIERRLLDRLEREIERRVPLYGPHLDDIRFLLTGRAARTSSSGEIAFGAFCLRLAETLVLADSGWPPIFLGDEIFSFMDEDRRRRSYALLSDLPFQTIITLQQVTESGGLLEAYGRIELAASR